MNRTTQLSIRRMYSGFTLLEMAFVLLVMGIVVSMLIPTVSGVHHKSMIEGDRKILGDLKEVLIGQLSATGKLPACVLRPATGRNPLGEYCDTQPSIGNLAVRTTDSRGKDIKYDVWSDPANDLTKTDTTTICSTLSKIIKDNRDASGPLTFPIATPHAGPALCSVTPDYDQYPPGTGATDYCTQVKNVAFVLVAAGATRPDNYPAEVPSWAVGIPGNRNVGNGRVFENPGRRHSETWHYDDVIEVVTFEQLSATLKCPVTP